jgi:hypothetical protein
MRAHAQPHNHTAKNSSSSPFTRNHEHSETTSTQERITPCRPICDALAPGASQEPRTPWNASPVRHTSEPFHSSTICRPICDALAPGPSQCASTLPEKHIQNYTIHPLHHQRFPPCWRRPPPPPNRPDVCVTVGMTLMTRMWWLARTVMLLDQ